jgi:TIR domain
MDQLMTNPKIKTLFVSYARAEKHWFRSILDALECPLENSVKFWTDNSLTAGAEFTPSIEHQIEMADGFLVIASKSYLASKYVNDTEWPCIERALGKGKQLFWVPQDVDLLHANPHAILSFLKQRHTAYGNLVTLRQLHLKDAAGTYSSNAIRDILDNIRDWATENNERKSDSQYEVVATDEPNWLKGSIEEPTRRLKSIHPSWLKSKNEEALEEYDSSERVDAQNDADNNKNDLQQESSSYQRSFSDMVLKSGYHPVFLFGSIMSGQTTVLGRLLNYLRINEEVHVELGSPIMSLDEPFGKAMYENAIDFFDVAVHKFMCGELFRKTTLEFPLPIPIILTEKGLPPVKLVFFHGMGEWIYPDEDNWHCPLRFKSELEAILINFNHPISLLYIAPYADPYANDFSCFDYGPDHGGIHDVALTRVMNTYNKVRGDKNYDKHLFLLTKWDLHAPENTRAFSKPVASDVIPILEQKFPVAWPKFNKMEIKNHNGEFSFMPFVAGLFSQADNFPMQVLTPSAAKKKEYDSYPRILANWLCINATSPAGKSGRFLFNDWPVPLGKLYDRTDSAPGKRNIFSKITQFFRD